MRWCGIENVMLNGNVFIIELIEKSMSRGVLRTRPKSRLAEFLGDDLGFGIQVSSLCPDVRSEGYLH